MSESRREEDVEKKNREKWLDREDWLKQNDIFLNGITRKIREARKLRTTKETLLKSAINRKTIHKWIDAVKRLDRSEIQIKNEYTRSLAGKWKIFMISEYATESLSHSFRMPAFQ